MANTTKSSIEQPAHLAIVPSRRSISINEKSNNDDGNTTKSNTEKNHEESKQSPSLSSQSSASSFQKSIQTLKWIIRDQWFLLAMSALILISSQVQVPGSQQKVKRTVITYLSVSVIFFINGCTFPTRTLIENWAKWKIHLFVQGQGYLVTSAVTFAVVSLCATNTGFSMSYSSSNIFVMLNTNSCSGPMAPHRILIRWVRSDNYVF